MIKLFKKLTDPFTISLIILIGLGISLFSLKYSPQNNEDQPWLSEKIETINRIEIKYQEKTDILKKENDQWLIDSEDNLPIKKEKIDRLLDGLEKLKKKELVSQNKNNHSKYGINQEKAIELKISENDNSLLHLLIGNAGPDFETNYIRLPEEDDVYLSNTALRFILLQSPWAEKQEAEDNQETFLTN